MPARPPVMQVTLVTNVACACGLTSGNYKEMVELQTKYGDKGLAIQCWPWWVTQWLRQHARRGGGGGGGGGGDWATQTPTPPPPPMAPEIQPSEKF